jgi:uncharacterized membrane protein
MTVGNVLAETLNLYRRLFFRTVVAAAVIFALLDLIEAIVQTRLAGNRSTLVPLFVLSTALTFVGTAFVQGALAEAVRDVHEGRGPAAVGELYDRTRSRVGTLAAAAFLAGLGVGAAALLFLIPGLLLWTRWSLVVPVIVLERSPLRGSFRRSAELVRGNGWRVFGVLVVVYLLGAVVGLVAWKIVSPLPGFWSAWIGGVLSSSIAAPLTAHALAVMYYKLTEPQRPVIADSPPRWQSIWDAERDATADDPAGHT